MNNLSERTRTNKWCQKVGQKFFSLGHWILEKIVFFLKKLDFFEKN